MAEKEKAHSQKPTHNNRPNPEVQTVAKRRRFSAKYKIDILDRIDRRKAEGREIGSLLRKEGLNTSHIAQWRKAREKGSLRALEPKKRGRKPEPDAEIRRELQRLRAENEKLQKKLEQAELVIDVQKKLSQLLGPDESK